MTKPVTPPTTRLGYPVAEAAAQIGVSRDQGFKLIACGKLRSYRVGRRRLVSREAIQEFIRSAEAATTEPGRNRRQGDVQAA